MKRLLLLLLLSASLPVSGYDFKDMCHDIAPSQDASKTILNALHSFETIQIGSDIEGFMDLMATSMDARSFYLGDLYRSDYFKPIDNDYRALTLKHVRNSGSNQIMAIPESYDDVDIHQFKDYIAIREIGIKANAIATVKKYRSYSFYYKSKSSWENAGDIRPLDMAYGMLKIIEPSNIKKMKVQSCGLHNDLKNETRVLMDDFSNTFPNLSSLVDRYVELNDFIEIENDKKNMIAYTHVKLQPKLKTKIVKKNYPEAAEYINKFRKLITTNVAIKNKNGNTYIKLYITPKITLLEGYTYQGKLIPVDENGNLVFEEAGTLEIMKELFGEIDLKIEILGLDINTHGKAIVENLSTPQKEAFRAKAESITYEYSGRLLGLIPMSVIKFLSPVDIDKFVDDMITVFLQGNQGEGTIVALEWKTDESQNRFSNTYISSEMLDHYVLEFLIKTGQKFLDLDSKEFDLAIDQSKDFAEKVFSAFILDAKTVFVGLEYSGGFVQK